MALGSSEEFRVERSDDFHAMQGYESASADEPNTLPVELTEGVSVDDVVALVDDWLRQPAFL